MESLVITAEELFVFSLSRELPLVPGILNLINSKENDPLLEKELEYATRVLASRGIPPMPINNGEEVTFSETLLTILSKPELRVVVSILDSKDARVRDMVRSGDTNIIHVWDKLNNHLIKKFSDYDFLDMLCFVSGQSDLKEGDDHECESIKISNLVEIQSLDDQMLADSIVKQNSTSKCIDKYVEVFVDFLKGNIPTVLIMFNGSSGTEASTAILTWFSGDNNSIWLLGPNESDVGDQISIKFNHVNKAGLYRKLKETFEGFIQSSNKANIV